MTYSLSQRKYDFSYFLPKCKHGIWKTNVFDHGKRLQKARKIFNQGIFGCLVFIFIAFHYYVIHF